MWKFHANLILGLALAGTGISTTPSPNDGHVLTPRDQAIMSTRAVAEFAEARQLQVRSAPSGSGSSSAPGGSGSGDGSRNFLSLKPPRGAGSGKGNKLGNRLGPKNTRSNFTSEEAMLRNDGRPGTSIPTDTRMKSYYIKEQPATVIPVNAPKLPLPRIPSVAMTPAPPKYQRKRPTAAPSGSQQQQASSSRSQQQQESSSGILLQNAASASRAQRPRLGNVSVSQLPVSFLDFSPPVAPPRLSLDLNRSYQTPGRGSRSSSKSPSPPPRTQSQPQATAPTQRQPMSFFPLQTSGSRYQPPGSSAPGSSGTGA